MSFFSRKQKERKRMEAWVTPEERAASLLSVALAENDGMPNEEITVLDKDLGREKIPETEVSTNVAPVVPEASQSSRKTLRVLVVSTDTSLFTTGSMAGTEYAALGDYLDELHIIVITFRREKSYVSRRIAPNVWVYPTNSRSPLRALLDVYRVTRKQVAFAAGFRADIIIATDAFEAGIAAYAVANRYHRPLQLQLSVNPFDADYVQEAKGNKWRVFAARFVIPRADCIFVRSQRLQTALEQRYGDTIGTVALLPPFHNLASFRDTASSFDLHERYPQFRFIILMISRLDARGLTAFAIDTCAPIMRQYSTIGMVIVGDGPLRKQLEKNVRDADLQHHVVFESATDEVVSHMKSANVFLNVVADEDHDILLAAAAAAGLPVLTVASDMASTLFEDGVNASVCPENDMVCLQARLGEFVNDNQLRATFSINARDQVFALMEQDIVSYRKAFIGSFETCVLKTYTDE